MIPRLGVVLAVAAILLVLSTPAPPASSSVEPPVKIAVPVYADSISAWSRTVNATPAVRVIIANPASSPGKSIDYAYAGLVHSAQARNISVLGYVPTDYANGSLSIQQAENLISEYYAWYHVDGIFLDEVNSTCLSGPLSYYSALYSFIKQGSGQDLVFLNPGGIPGECYAKISDVLVTFEQGYSAYLAYKVPLWMWNYPSDHFLNMVLDTPTASDMQNAINLAVAKHAAWVYVTDQGTNKANAYNALPLYFQDEVAYSEAANVTVSTVTLTTSGQPAAGASGTGLPEATTVTITNSTIHVADPGRVALSAAGNGSLGVANVTDVVVLFAVIVTSAGVACVAIIRLRKMND